MLVKFFPKSILFSIIFIKLRKIRNNLIFFEYSKCYIANSSIILKDNLFYKHLFVYFLILFSYN